MQRGLCQGLHQAQQKRCGRCRDDLRGVGRPEHAVCGDQNGRAASRIAAAPRPGSAAHNPGQCAACAPRRARGNCPAGVGQPCRSRRHRRRYERRAPAGSGAPGAGGCSPALEQLTTAVVAIEKELMADIGTTRSVSVWRVSRGSGRSSPRRWPRPGWVWCRGSTRPGAKRGLAAFASAATGILAASADQRRQYALGRPTRSLDHRAAPPAAKPGRGGGLSEQDGAHCLGGDAPRGELSASGCSGITAKRRTEACERARKRDGTVGRSDSIESSRRFIGTAIPFE
jgi:hypothetical protein